MSSMYAQIGGSRIPEAKRSPPMTRLDALIGSWCPTNHSAIIAMQCWILELKTKLQISNMAFTKFVIDIGSLKKSNAAQRS